MTASRLGETLTLVLCVLVAFLLALTTLGAANYLLDESTCKQYGVRTQQPVMFEFPSGCYVYRESHWIPLSFIRSSATVLREENVDARQRR